MAKRAPKQVKVMPSTNLTVNSETLPATEWAARLGTPVQTILGRLARGWSVEKACTEPLNQNRGGENRGDKLPAEPLTPAEMSDLLKQCSARGASGIRNKAMLVLGWRAGLRCNEALQLMPKDLDHEARTVRVLHGKGDKARIVGLDDGSWAILQRWFDKRASLGINGRNPVFCTLKGEPLKAVYVRNLLKRLAKKAGIDKRVHFHAMRHTHAFELANEGTPLHVIQQQLGHSSLAVTDRYIRHLNPQEVVKTMQARKWNAEE